MINQKRNKPNTDRRRKNERKEGKKCVFLCYLDDMTDGSEEEEEEEEEAAADVLRRERKDDII